MNSIKRSFSIFIANPVPMIVIIRLGGCVANYCIGQIVILNLIQNLVVSVSYGRMRSRNKFGMTVEIHSLDRIIQFFFWIAQSSWAMTETEDEPRKKKGD
jgi:hypothetical protein